MTLIKKDKNELIREIRDRLSTQNEIYKIVIFGSFNTSDSPADIDIAIFQNSDENYLPLSMKYRKLTREISKRIPIDIIPLKQNPGGSFMREIEQGEIIYER